MVRAANPFQPAPGATPPTLVGRGAELSAIRDALDRAVGGGRPTPLAFFGLRGLGKTVLLHRIVADSARNAVHLDIEVEPGISLAASFREAIDLVRERDKPIKSRLGDAFDAVVRHVPMPSYELPGEMGSLTLARENDAPVEAPLGRALAMFHRAVGDAGKYLVITVDEVQDADLASLRTVVARVNQSVSASRPIVFACAGLPQARTTLRALRTYTTRWDQFDLTFLARARASKQFARRSRRCASRSTIARSTSSSRSAPVIRTSFRNSRAPHGTSIVVRPLPRPDVAAIVPGVRSAIERTFYGDAFAALTVRETAVALALADLGPGPHALKKIAERLDTRSDALGSVRSNLLRKELVFVPMPGTLQFRMPLADRYAREHRAELETSEVAAYRF